MFEEPEEDDAAAVGNDDDPLHVTPNAAAVIQEGSGEEDAVSSDDPEAEDRGPHGKVWENFVPRRSGRRQKKKPGEGAAQKK